MDKSDKHEFEFYLKEIKELKQKLYNNNIKITDLEIENSELNKKCRVSIYL